MAAPLSTWPFLSNRSSAPGCLRRDRARDGPTDPSLAPTFRSASGDRLLVLLCLRRLDAGLIGMPGLLHFPRLVVAELGVVREIALLRPLVVARDVPVAARRHHTPRARSQQRQRDDAADAEGDIDDALSR